ncbi:MAG: DUF1549 domain-containing protein, partial [Verrucomicrobia bacterium]|nr:DUF1549 domain-containing protein [Verrucomicrobiota bacterium]
NPIDAFVLSRLNRERLSPSPEADRTTLHRRLSLDLIGLPPTPEEVDRFLNDSSPDAYDKQVDRLLNSPHFGERWGRVWLDAARYADSDGFEKDKPRFVWHYRDWVVRALNRNLPYDRFILEQIAGDLLPNATDEQRVATGFLRNAMLNEEGGVDPEQFRMDGLFDRMDCIGKSVLALTIQCAQCHDHKFDPISQEDYYRLFAFLNNDHESSRVAYTTQEELKRSELIRKIRETEEAHRHRTPGWEARMAAWEKEMNSRQIAWETVNAVNAGDNSARYYYLEDGSIRASGYAPTQWSSHFRATNHNRSIRAFQIEQLVDPNLPSGGPGRSIRGMAALTEFTVEASDLTAPTNKIKVKFVRASADYSNPEKDLEPEFDNQSGKRRPYGPVAFAIDGKDDTAWGIDAGPGRRNQSRKAVFNTEKPIEFPNGVILDFHLKQNHGGYNSDDNQNHNLGRFRLSVTSSADAMADPVPAGVREIMAIPASARSAAQTATVFSNWRTTVPEFKALNEEIEQLWSQHPEGAPTLMLASRTGQGAGNEMRETRMFKRGDWLKPEREVKAGVPGFLHGLPEGA